MLVPCFSNFYVKLQQPLNGLGPYNAYLQEHGLGVMNLQIHTADAQAVRATLEQQGATWVLSTAADPWAYVDTEDKLGWILEPINFLLRFPPKLDPNNTLPLGARPVTRVGIAVDKLETAVTVYSKFFNIPAPAITELQGIAVSGSQTRSLRVAGWTQGAGIELVESPAAGTPWSEHVRVHGWQALSLGFDVGDRLEDYHRDLLSKGGKLIFKTADGSRVYLDFRDTLGLVIELDGTPAAN